MLDEVVNNTVTIAQQITLNARLNVKMLHAKIKLKLCCSVVFVEKFRVHPMQ